jgi:hypothetical protein
VELLTGTTDNTLARTSIGQKPITDSIPELLISHLGNNYTSHGGECQRRSTMLTIGSSPISSLDRLTIQEKYWSPGGDTLMDKQLMVMMLLILYIVTKEVSYHSRMLLPRKTPFLLKELPSLSTEDGFLLISRTEEADLTNFILLNYKSSEEHLEKERTSMIIKFLITQIIMNGTI